MKSTLGVFVGHIVALNAAYHTVAMYVMERGDNRIVRVRKPSAWVIVPLAAVGLTPALAVFANVLAGLGAFILFGLPVLIFPFSLWRERLVLSEQGIEFFLSVGGYVSVPWEEIESWSMERDTWDDSPDAQRVYVHLQQSDAVIRIPTRSYPGHFAAASAVAEFVSYVWNYRDERRPELAEGYAPE